ncbi:MAG TPA: PAS domain S-box protein, partial [Bacteroidales bacterium]
MTGYNVYDFFGQADLNEMSVLNITQCNTLFQSLDIPIWAIDTKYKLIAFNKAFSNYFKLKYRTEVYNGMNIEHFIKTDKLTDWNNLVSRSLKKQRPKAETQLVFNKTTHYFEIVAQPIIENETVIGISFLSHDITDRKRTIGILSKAKAQLQ